MLNIDIISNKSVLIYVYGAIHQYDGFLMLEEFNLISHYGDIKKIAKHLAHAVFFNSTFPPSLI